MNNTHTDFRYQLYRLDQAIFQLVEERTQVTAQIGEVLAVAVDDLLARHQGNLNATELKTIASAMDEACANHLARTMKSQP